MIEELKRLFYFIFSYSKYQRLTAKMIRTEKNDKAISAKVVGNVSLGNGMVALKSTYSFNDQQRLKYNIEEES